MATPYTTVYDSFMESVKDYQLVALYQSSPTNFYVYLKGFLKGAIIEFRNCQQDLTDRNDTTRTFNIDLEDEVVYILGQLMVKQWMTKEVQDVLQMRAKITDRDFKHYSEAQNLKSKQDYLILVDERTSQLMTDYEFKNVDWVSWANGDFGIGA